MGNLYLSFLLRPACTPDQGGQIAFVTALALSRALNPFIDANVHQKALKWPNDILIDRLKISGILLETKLSADSAKVEYLIVGVGVNLFSAPEGRMALHSIATQPVYVHKFRDSVLAEMEAALDIWKKKGFAPIRDAWLNQAYGIGEPISVRLPEVTHAGVFHGIDENGGLLLETEAGLKTFTAGDVHFGVR